MRENTQIVDLEAALFEVPLDEVLVDAKHGAHSHFQLICVTICLADGRRATGYTYTGGRGGHAILALIRNDLAPFLVGRCSTDIESLYEQMLWHMHYVGRGGIVSFAISAVDIALWDLRCKAAGLPLWRMAGGAGNRCKAYAGGIDLAFPLPKLCGHIKAYLAAGFNAVKIKVGQPSLEEDVARIRAVRALIGPDIHFMIDANYALNVAQAIALAKAVRDQNILWFEEPIIPENFAAMRKFPRRPASRLRRVKTCIRMKSSKWRWRKASWALFSLMRQIVGASRAGCAWRLRARALACRFAVMGCKNYTCLW